MSSTPKAPVTVADFQEYMKGHLARQKARGQTTGSQTTGFTSVVSGENAYSQSLTDRARRMVLPIVEAFNAGRAADERSGVAVTHSTVNRGQRSQADVFSIRSPAPRATGAALEVKISNVDGLTATLLKSSFHDGYLLVGAIPVLGRGTPLAFEALISKHIRSMVAESEGAPGHAAPPPGETAEFKKRASNLMRSVVGEINAKREIEGLAPVKMEQAVVGEYSHTPNMFFGLGIPGVGDLSVTMASLGGELHAVLKQPQQRDAPVQLGAYNTGVQGGLGPFRLDLTRHVKRLTDEHAAATAMPVIR